MSEIVQLSHNLLLSGANKSVAVDATCGNGHDTLFLCRHFEQVYAFDIQDLALRRTAKITADYTNLILIKDDFKNLCYHLAACDAIIFNLGFLPGSDRKIKTDAYHSDTAVVQAYRLLNPKGVMVICCYTKHEGGEAEYQRLVQALSLAGIAFTVYTGFPNAEVLLEIRK
jgi:SAM-dependent methyltransferase